MVVAGSIGRSGVMVFMLGEPLGGWYCKESHRLGMGAAMHGRYYQTILSSGVIPVAGQLRQRRCAPGGFTVDHQYDIDEPEHEQGSRRGDAWTPGSEDYMILSRRY